jgi:hypothetical protein
MKNDQRVLDRALATMRAGAVLRLEYDKIGGRHWLNGRFVPNAVAAQLKHMPGVTSGRDGLFPATPQSWHLSPKQSVT